MLDRKFWENLDVNYQYILDNWDEHYMNSLVRFLKKLDDINLFDICERLDILPNKDIKKDNKNKLINIIIESDKSQILGLLLDFYKYKAELINDHFKRLLESKKIVCIKKGNTFLKLLEIYLYDQKELKNILIYHYWYRNISFSQLFKPSIPFRDEFINDFENKIDKFTIKLKSGNWKNLKYRYYGKIQIGSKTIYSIIRQTGDKLIRNVDTNKRNKVASDLLLAFDKERNLLEIRCRDKKIIKKSIKKLESLISLYFEYHLPSIEDINSNLFNQKLDEDLDQLDVQIAGISFFKSNIEGKVPLAIPASSNINSINKSIKDLKERDLVNMNLQNIRSFTISYNDKNREIELVNEKDYQYFSLKKYSKLDDTELKEISHLFKSIVGVGLKERFSLETVENLDKEKIINQIINSSKMDHIHPNFELLILDLEKKGIITTNEDLIHQCLHCRRINRLGTACPHCNSVETQLIRTNLNIKLNKKVIVEYIIRKINDDEIKLLDKKATRTWGRKYEFIKMDYKGTHVFIYVSYGKITPNLISFFQRSFLPIIIISTCESPGEDIIGLTNFDHFTLSSLLADNIEHFIFVDAIKGTVSNSYSKIAAAASDSNRKLRKLQSYNGDYFEDDVCNILRIIFKNVEKWGKEKKGKEIPEGITYLNFNTKSGLNQRTLSWDCKYTDKEYYNLSIGEKRKVESYIRKLNDLTEVKNTSKSLNSFLLISNSIKQEQFEKLGERTIQKIRKWRGNIIWLNLEVLLKLYKLCNEKHDFIADNYNEFKIRLSKLFMDKRKDRTYKIKEEDLNTLFNLI